MIRMALNGGKIHVRLPWSPTNEKIMAQVRGGRWSQVRDRWVFPLDYNTCKEIREAADRMGEEIKIGRELTIWAQQEKDRLAHVPSAMSLERTELPNLKKNNPKMYKAMNNRPFQTVGASFAANHRQVLLADDPGLGKSLQTIGAYLESDIRGPILVIAPKIAAEQVWPEQLLQWAPNEDVTSIAGLTPAKRTALLEQFLDRVEAQTFGQYKPRQWLIVNPFWVSMKAELDEKGNYKHGKNDRLNGLGVTFKMEQLFQVEWAGIIIDESQETLIIPSMNRKRWTQARLGIENLPYRPEAVRMGLSGTPMRGLNEKLFGTLQWLKPKHYTSYHKWTAEHFEIAQDGTIGKLKDKDYTYKQLSELMIRRTKEEVAADLPPKIYGGTNLDPLDESTPVGIWLDMMPKQAKQYHSFVKDGAAYTDDGGVVIANGILSEWTRQKQIATSVGGFNADGKFIPAPYVSNQSGTTSNKMDWIIQFLAERGITAKPEGDGKVIIASQFAEVVKWVVATLNKIGIKTFSLIGATTRAKRLDAMREFQDPNNNRPDDVRVFVLSTKAAGVALTLDMADNLIIIDETFNPDDQIQLENRCHRISRVDHQVFIWYLRSLGTIEEAISATTQGKAESNALLLDKSRGVELRRIVKEYEPITRKVA